MDVTGFEIGDRVITVDNNGCYAEMIKVNQKQVYQAIPGYSHVENAAFTSSFLTAYICLKEMARVRKGENLLVQAAAGGLGTAAVLLGKTMGLAVAGTSSRENKLDYLRNKLIQSNSSLTGSTVSVTLPTSQIFEMMRKLCSKVQSQWERKFRLHQGGYEKLCMTPKGFMRVQHRL